MKYYAGATYEWKNPQGNVVSNTRTYPIANYTAANNGTYICKITWSNCVTRYVNVTLNGNLCGQPLGFLDAVNDINQVPAGSTVTGNVLTNDETTGLTVQSATYYNASGVVTPLQLGTATPIYTAAGVLAGTMTLNADGSYTFASSSTFSGDVPVNYTAVNAEGSTDTATLEIKVIPVVSAGNDNPIAQNDTATTEAGVSVTSNALANDSDPDGNLLTITAATQGATTLVVNGSTPNTVSGVDSAGNPVANAGTLVLNPNGTYTFVPAAGFTGTIDPVTYTISDGNGGTDTAVINISVYPNSGNNVFANDDVNSGPKGSTMNGNVLTNDFDPENNTFTVTSATANGTAITIGTATVIPGVGTLTLNANGSYTFVPLANFVGTLNVPYTVCDNGTPQACDSATLYLTALPSLSLSVCYETPIDLTTSVPVNHGITVLKRAGTHTGITTANDWQMVRNSAYTALESKTKGFVITRNASPETTIANPVVGMMVFDTDAPGVNGATGCLKIYTGSGASEGWKCFNTQGCP
jgi:CshA-type fibril repeat protein